ncbi:peptide deformylase [Candidatus Aerophobetes bacterium]|nr:peptide deformylase [Candidatus Aerophobetes bacterium]
MPVYPIRKYPDSILREKCKRIEKVGPRERKILAQMAETMYKAKGVGLAAPQVGINAQLIVVDVGEGLVKLVNPQVLLREGKSILEEGCLSLPGITVKVERAKKVRVQGWDEKGERIEIDGKDLFAHALQHEIDHLQGVLIIDYTAPGLRERIEEKLAQLEESYM